MAANAMLIGTPKNENKLTEKQEKQEKNGYPPPSSTLNAFAIWLINNDQFAFCWALFAAFSNVKCCVRGKWVDAYMRGTPSERVSRDRRSWFCYFSVWRGQNVNYENLEFY